MVAEQRIAKVLGDGFRGLVVQAYEQLHRVELNVALVKTFTGRGAGEHVGAGVLAEEQGGCVDPRASAFPACNARRFEEVLAHGFKGFNDRAFVADRRTGLFGGADDDLDRALDLLADDGLVVEVTALEKARQYGLDFKVFFLELFRHRFDDLAGRAIEQVPVVADVGDEMSVELERDKPSASRVFKQDFDKAFAIDRAFLAEDGFAAFIVHAVVEFEIVVVDEVAGQSAGALLDVVFGVVAFAEGEQFHQFAGEVFVGTLLAVLVVVEELDHRGVADDAQCEFFE